MQFRNHAGGVRHEIRPIRMRYSISSLCAQTSVWRGQPVENFVINEVCEIFSQLKFVLKLEKQIGLMLVRLLLKLNHLFAFVAISKVTTSRLPPSCFGCLFTAFLEAKATYSCWVWPILLHVKLGYPFYFRIFGVYPGLPLMV